MKDALSILKGWMVEVTEILLLFIALSVVVGIIWPTGFLGQQVIANIMAVVTQLGSGGFAGIVALLIIVHLFNKK